VWCERTINFAAFIKRHLCGNFSEDEVQLARPAFFGRPLLLTLIHLVFQS
jgi:hypothetical protein